MAAPQRQRLAVLAEPQRHHLRLLARIRQRCLWLRAAGRRLGHGRITPIAAFVAAASSGPLALATTPMSGWTGWAIPPPSPIAKSNPAACRPSSKRICLPPRSLPDLGRSSLPPSACPNDADARQSRLRSSRGQPSASRETHMEADFWRVSQAEVLVEEDPRLALSRKVVLSPGTLTEGEIRQATKDGWVGGSPLGSSAGGRARR